MAIEMLGIPLIWSNAEIVKVSILSLNSSVDDPGPQLVRSEVNKRIAWKKVFLIFIVDSFVIKHNVGEWLVTQTIEDT